ncbi:hypothetical protein MKW94_023296 [Papaver nudicaule]|uniref:RING-type domain-containing protein n=1 Tax=Papaver nudicaule TaxID=74823 RepID=A0AA41SCY3_PAPNU|nr:hypothetical protein [Papaver nudicaule]
MSLAYSYDDCFDLDLALTMDMESYTSSPAQNLSSTTPAAKTDISLIVSNLPTVAMVETCSICMGESETSTEEGKRLPCNHVYHLECISKWISRSNNSCPLCRTPITG